ncbi:MAG: hypothetical protein REJ50_14885, partial [Bordetella sp.]|nr:hypothetical protein [Bordetella sp.]
MKPGVAVGKCLARDRATPSRRPLERAGSAGAKRAAAAEQDKGFGGKRQEFLHEKYQILVSYA